MKGIAIAPVNNPTILSLKLLGISTGEVNKAPIAIVNANVNSLYGNSIKKGITDDIVIFNESDRCELSVNFLACFSILRFKKYRLFYIAIYSNLNTK